MAYIGNTAPSRFVSNRAASVYSGDGSTVAFTLEQVVTQDEDVLVSVDGVIQEPSVGYAVSSGTTLTFSAAPSTNSGNNIFVYYLASQAGTVGHPSSQALSATNGTFSTTLNTTGNVGIFTQSGLSSLDSDAKMLQINGSYLTHFDNDASGTTSLSNNMFFDGTNNKSLYSGQASQYFQNTGNHYFRTAPSNGANATLSPVTVLAIDATGAVTKPLQPAFMARPASAQTGISSGTTLVFGTEIFDQNADFASNTFTAPTTGRYHISYTLYFEDVRNDITAFYVTTVLSNRDIYTILDPQAYDQTVTNLSLNFSLLADMDASDTVFLKYYQTGGGDNTNMNVHSYFTGYLVA